jgi:hypothetical protein
VSGLEQPFDGSMETALVLFDRKYIVGVQVDNGLGDLDLAVNGLIAMMQPSISSPCNSLQMAVLSIVRLVVDLGPIQHQVIGGGPGADQGDACLPKYPVAGAA